MIAAGELAVQRRLTAEFIAADAIEVELLRAPITSDGAGGYLIGTPVARAIQVFRLIPSQDGAQPRLTADGVEVTPSYMLMGPAGVDMARFDEFVVDGRRYQIVFLNENRQYEVKGEVAYLVDVV
jgi:hypothetical protein